MKWFKRKRPGSPAQTVPQRQFVDLRSEAERQLERNSTQPLDEAELHRRLLALKADFQAEVALGAAMHPGEKTQIIKIVLLTPGGEQAFERPYGGPPKLAARYAVNHSLNLLRTL